MKKLLTLLTVISMSLTPVQASNKQHLKKQNIKPPIKSKFKLSVEEVCFLMIDDLISKAGYPVLPPKKYYEFCETKERRCVVSCLWYFSVTKEGKEKTRDHNLRLIHKICELDCFKKAENEKNKF